MKALPKDVIDSAPCAERESDTEAPFLSDPSEAGESEPTGCGGVGVQDRPDARRERIRELSAQNALLRDALSRASHDLRNPLVSVRGLAHVLASHPGVRSDSEVQGMIGSIEAACERGLELVAEILDSAYDQSINDTTAFRLTDICEIVVRAMRTLEGAALDKAVRIHPTGSHEPLYCNCRANRLQAAIENLIANAVKSSPPGGTVAVDTRVFSRSVAVSVRDQGAGISEHDRHLLFHELQRGAPPARRSDPGFGLGLHFCRQIVAAHAGTIDCRNLPEGGCEFVIYLPRP